DRIFSETFRLDPASPAADMQNALESFSPDVAFVHKMADTDVIKRVFESETPAVRMVHDHDLCCMRRYKYNYFSRRICTRSASLYCVFPCGASLERRRGSWFPFRWVSYWAKRQEIALNRRFDRLIVATSYMREELLRNGFGPEQIEIHA